jgi:hypothetical protein
MLHVSRFVSEGVREARLHLNPVEMGPIEVRIACPRFRFVNRLKFWHRRR